MTKFAATILCLSFLLSSCSTVLTQEKVYNRKPVQIQKLGEEPSKKKLSVILTAYTHTESDHIKYGRKTALGTKLRASGAYRSAASDWSFLPVGTIFEYAGQKYKIDDYGKALVGTKKVDLYKPSKYQMRKFGKKNKEIQILAMGDFKKSKEILKPRLRYGNYLRRMYYGINERL